MEETDAIRIVGGNGARPNDTGNQAEHAAAIEQDRPGSEQAPAVVRKLIVFYRHLFRG